MKFWIAVIFVFLVSLYFLFFDNHHGNTPPNGVADGLFLVLFWFYASIMLVLSAMTFWKNIMAITQAPFKIKWIIFSFKSWFMERAVRRFLRMLPTANISGLGNRSARLTPPQDL